MRATLHSSVGRSTIGSFVSGAAAQAGLLGSGILSSRILGPEDRGYLALLILAPLILCHVGGLGLPLATTYYIGKTPASAGAIIRLLVKPALLQIAVFGVVEALVLRTYADGQPADVQRAALLCGLLLPSWLASEYGYAILQGQQRFGVFNVVRSWSKLLHALILAVIFALGRGSLPLVAGSWLAVSWLETAVTLLVVSRGVDWAFRPSPLPRLRQMARFGATALPGAISPIETLRLDQVIMGWFAAPAPVGIYVTAGSFTNLPRFVAQSVGVIAYPYVTAQAHRATAWRATWRFFWVSLLIALAMAGVVAALAETLIPLFFGDEFVEAVPVARILLLASALASGRRVLADGARGLGYPGLGTMAEVVSWSAILVAAPFLLGRYGTSGMAAALVIGASVGLVTLVVGLSGRSRGGAKSVTAHVSSDDIAMAEGP
jgi:O-antigen/teichoic acid export membrane protein